MKWYNLIWTPNESGTPPYSFVAKQQELFGRNESDFIEGRVINDWNERSLLRATDPTYDGRVDDFLGNPARLPVFSGRLQVALEKDDVGVSDIQFLPIRLMRVAGEELSGFAVANVISRVAALDPDRSFMLELDYNKIDPLTSKPKVKSVGRAALREEPLRGHDVVRLLESRYDVFVSERFVKVFEAHGFTGARFNQVTVT